MRITENRLDAWVRRNSRQAQGVIVELVWRLVCASAPKPRERRFPLGDSIGQPGPDGELRTDLGCQPFVPPGRSIWEIGAGEKPALKASEDYKDRTTKRSTAIAAGVRREATFVFVTPLSGTRGWGQPAQTKWLKARLAEKRWKDVRIIDGARLVDWLSHYPAVEVWLAQKMHEPMSEIGTLEDEWGNLHTIGGPPPLLPGLFLANRAGAIGKLKQIFSNETSRLRLDTHYPDQIVDFVASYVATIDEEERTEILGRCAIVYTEEAWDWLTGQQESHVLIADDRLDLNDDAAVKLVEKAKRFHHSIIYWGRPGGSPNANAEPLSSPHIHEIKTELEKAGYSEERARVVAQQSGGNLGALLRCLQNVSLLPRWASDAASADIVIAALVGGWVEKSMADRAAVEKISGKAYGEWIRAMRRIANCTGTPLRQNDGVWKFTTRYEGWFALGPQVHDDHLTQLLNVVLEVLRERDPSLDLPEAERCMATIRNKVMKNSRKLREGLSETLALLGSHPKALSSCSHGKPESVATIAVRGILSDADWRQWASVNDVLPLLAEAAPSQFLDAVESALSSDPCPFDDLFAQEGGSFAGHNYMTGLLWALETLAWDEEYLSRVVVLLGGLAARDPGGSWSNRPSNSLATILLPWLPQTCASVQGRRAAVVALLKEAPDVAWKVLNALLPHSHSMSMGCRRPAWRQIIPEDRSGHISQGEFWEQVIGYGELAVMEAKKDVRKAADLARAFDSLPPPAQGAFLEYLKSDSLTSIGEREVLELWTELVTLITKHRKYHGAKWAMRSEQVDRLEEAAARLRPKTPQHLHKRLFSGRDFELFEEKGDFAAQRNELAERRKAAVHDILAHGGPQAVVEFANTADSSWQVGVALGAIGDGATDTVVLPLLLSTEGERLTRFVAGFVSSRFCSQGWKWIDSLPILTWEVDKVASLLSFLPFSQDTWQRVSGLLKDQEEKYWRRVAVVPFGAKTESEVAAERLLKYGRPLAAVQCLYGSLHEKQGVHRKLAVESLLASIRTDEPSGAVDPYEMVEVIKALQDDPLTPPDDLFKIEWAYLQLLGRDHGATPVHLERSLATDPEFFCKIIRLIYRSRKDKTPKCEATESEKIVAGNADHLLHSWRIPPGLKEDGAVDGAALRVWIERVQAECGKSGHVEVAMITVGHVLVYCPPDPSGLWIHKSAAEILNGKIAGDIRQGFTSELFNSRGVHGFTHGREEMKIASGYRDKARALDMAGYSRFGASMNELAQSYERDSEREKGRDPFED